MGTLVPPPPHAYVDAGKPWSPPASAAAGGQWHVVREQNGLSVAHAAERFWAVGDGLRLFSALAPGWGVAAGDDGVAPPRTALPGAPRRAVRRCHRQPECQDRHPKPGRGVRSAQKKQRAQAASVGRHPGADRRRGGDGGWTWCKT